MSTMAVAMSSGTIQRRRTMFSWTADMKQLYPAAVRPKAESVLAWAAAAVGVIGIVSASTPEFADRLDAVRGVLPPGTPTAARIATLSFGIALVWLSRSLARRRRH